MDVILDTNAVSALLRGDTALAALLEPAKRHHLPVIVIGEYRYGLIRSRHRKTLQAFLETLIRESLVLRIDETTTTYYAAVRNELRETGSPIPENDVWIAALARQHGQPIVSRDEHFDEIAETERLGW
ncbi:MAG: type II toxin-antitoxin system VapC family toxin [Acidobacteria bacterium]|nr:type II toxin-antitoxin system VapC family toxin [Acidobacteriota bacterium]